MAGTERSTTTPIRPTPTTASTRSPSPATTVPDAGPSHGGPATERHTGAPKVFERVVGKHVYQDRRPAEDQADAPEQ